jgi:hypothetical protein
MSRVIEASLPAWTPCVKTDEVTGSRYNALAMSKASACGNGRAALAPGFKYNGSPVFLSEFGGIAYPMPGSPVPADAWGYAGVEKTPEAALERLRSLYVGIAKIPQIMGICYTQLTDV